MKSQTQHLLQERQINAGCKTLISTLSVTLIIVFALFVMDMGGYSLQEPISHLIQQKVEIGNKFISAVETKEPKLTGQGRPSQKKTAKIIRPLVDNKKYRYIELPNRMKVLLIHDADSEMATAALDVQAASWNEPSEFPGLAHFCEHMLFVGSEKYPQMGSFDELLAQGGGSSNAYTESTNTNFYFEVSAHQLDPVLDAFAQFFIAPLFNPEAAAKEVNAVNSEYEIDVSSEDWKIVNLMSLLADQKHPASRFSIGNNDSLSKQGIAEALRKYFEENYSSNLMALALQSSLSLDKMEKMVRNGFSAVKDRDLKFEFPGQPFKTQQIVTLKSEKKTLFLDWQLEGRSQYQHQKPIEFIDSFISSPVHGGLKHYLTSNQLAVDLQGSAFIEDQAFLNYILEVNLPQEVDSLTVVNAVHNYMQQLREWLSDKDYAQKVFNEQSQLSKINFDFMSGSQDISSVAKSLNRNQYTEVLSVNYILDVFDHNLLLKYLDELISTDNLLVIRCSSEEQKQKNELYRLEFSQREFQTEDITSITKKLDVQFTRPADNEFIPSNLELVSLCQKLQLPQLVDTNTLKSQNLSERITTFLSAGTNLSSYSSDECNAEETEYLKLNTYPVLLGDNHWYKIDLRFQVPTVFGALKFQLAQLNPEQFTALRLYNIMVDNEIQQELYQPLSGGYNYELDMHTAIQLKVYGFSEKVRNFFKKICSCINPFDRPQKATFLQVDGVSSKEFENAKNQLLNQIQEIKQMKLFEQALTIYLQQIMKPNSISLEQLEAEIPNMNEEKLQQEIQLLLSKTAQTSLLIGNLDLEQAKDLSNELDSCVSKKEPLEQQTQNIASLQGKNVIFSKFMSEDIGDLNGAVINYYQIGARTSKNFAIMKLLQDSLNNQAYNYLRTDLQLGYVVAMRFRPMGCVDGALILVQGSKETPLQVDQHIEDFIKQFDQYLSDINDKQLRGIKMSAISALKEKTKTLTEEGDRIWGYINDGDLLFEERLSAIEDIKALKKQDLIDFYRSNFIANQSKLSIQLYGEGLAQQLKIANQEQFEKYISQNIGKREVLTKLDLIQCGNDVSSI